MKLLVDTSFLMRAAELGRDMLAAVEEKLGAKVVPVVPSFVASEIERLASLNNAKARKARVALEICRRAELAAVDASGRSVDDALLEAAKNLGIPVLTSDRSLRRKLLDAGVAVVYVGPKGGVRLNGLFV